MDSSSESQPSPTLEAPRGPDGRNIYDPDTALRRRLDRAGLHTGDRLVSVNGVPMTSWPDFRRTLRSLTLGATLKFEIVRPNGPFTTSVVVAGYERPTVTIGELPGITEKQRRLQTAWVAGTP